MSMKSRFRLLSMFLLGSVLTLLLQHVTKSDLGVVKFQSIIAQSFNYTKYVPATKSTPIPTTHIPTTPEPYPAAPHILRWNGTGWTKWSGFCPKTTIFDSALLKTPAGNLPIYIHEIKKDRYVSGSIKRFGSWEGNIVNLIYNYLQLDTDLHLLDIGSHIGQFSLMAAHFGRKAVAIDPLFENVQRLCKSIDTNHFNSKIKVFYVALSDTRKKMSFQREQGNIGGTKVLSVGVANNPTTRPVGPVQLNVPYKVNTIETPKQFDVTNIDTVLLDDLLPLVPFKKAFMKIDVESHENRVLRGATKFFETIDIPFIFMEWFQHAKMPSALEIITFMRKHNYREHFPRTPLMPIVNIPHKKWPDNVLWVKSK